MSTESSLAESTARLFAHLYRTQLITQTPESEQRFTENGTYAAIDGVVERLTHYRERAMQSPMRRALFSATNIGACTTIAAATGGVIATLTGGAPAEAVRESS